ncbi:hypothetical protein ABPG75_010303 [Micractinium tetrahymenae]
MVALMNEQRARHGAPPTVWNDTLAAQAQAWTDRCVWKHSRETTGGDYGENLAGALGRDKVDPTTGLDACSSAAMMWYDEVNYYDWAAADAMPVDVFVGQWPPSYDSSKSTGHFTQVVWADSTSFGCGVTDCANPFGFGPAAIVACQFFPAGNYPRYRLEVFRTACQNRTGDDGCAACSPDGACMACYEGIGRKVPDESDRVSSLERLIFEGW